VAGTRPQYLGVVSESTEVADALVTAIHGGDVTGLRGLLTERPGVASSQLGGRYKTRPRCMWSPTGPGPNWIPGYANGTPFDAAAGPGTQRDNLIGWLRERGAHAADMDF
jgi:hypothetical protein